MERPLARILKPLAPLIIVAAAGFGAVTMIMNRPPVETLTPVIELPGVRVHEVEIEDVPLAVTSQGTVQPRTESQLVPEIAGRVTWVAPSFAEGGFFEAGDALVRIDPFDYEQMLVSARSQLAQARLRLAQEEAEAEVAQREWETLGRGDPRELALRKPQLEDARASVAAAEAGVERATRDLERAEIVAPYAGRVRTKNVDIGQYVRVGDDVATIYAVDVAEIRLPLPDDELAYLDLPLSYRGVRQRTQPRVTLRATFAGETHAWAGRVVRTESEIDSVSRMVHAIAEVADPYAPGPNPNRPPLAVGMYVEAEISGRIARDVAVLPRPALRGRDQVLVVTPDDRLSFRDVDVLRTSTESVIVRAGLQAGELVVVSPLDTPTDGMRVQLADADPRLLERRARAAANPAGPAAPPESAPVAGTPAAPRADAPTPSPEASGPAERADGDAASGMAVADSRSGAVPRTERAAGGAASGTAPATARADRPAWLASLLEEGDQPARNGPGVPRPQRAAPEPARGDVRRNAGARTARAPGCPGPAPAEEERATAGRQRAGAPDTIAVASFASLNAAGDPGFGPALGRAVATRLAASGRFTVADDETGARYVVRGGVQQVGAAVRVTARIVDTANGAVLHAVKIDGAAGDRATLEAEVATAVIENLPASRGRTAAAAGRMPAAETPSALAVLPFDDLTAGSAPPLDVDLAGSITRAVAAQAAALPEVTVVTPADRAAWAIGGGIQRIGSLVRVTARLTDVRSRAVVTAVKVDGTLEALADLRSRVAARMIESLRDALAGEAAASGNAGAADATRPEGRRS